MCHVLIQMLGLATLRAVGNRCYKLGLRLVTLAILTSADIVEKMATEMIVSKFECYRNCIESQN